VSGRINQIDQILVPVRMSVDDRHRLRFDCDSALALDFELVQELRGGGGREGPGHLEETVGERGFAVVDVRDDGEVPTASSEWHATQEIRIEGVM
jgi:hypothetical protein